MSDVIAAAAIAGGVGLAGNIVTFLVTRYAATQESLRRRRDQLQTERTLRNEKYSEVAWCLRRLRKYGRMGFPPNQTDWMDWLDQWAYWSGVALIVGSEKVTDLVNEFTNLLDEIGPELLESASKDDPQAWRQAYSRHEQRIEWGSQNLFKQMQSYSGPEIKSFSAVEG